jgi:hypothetical protein
MNERQKDLATRILVANLFKQVKAELPKVAKSVIEKFDRGPKPDKESLANVSLDIQIRTRALYEIEAKVKEAIGGNSKPC